MSKIQHSLTEQQMLLLVEIYKMISLKQFLRKLDLLLSTIVFVKEREKKKNLE